MVEFDYTELKQIIEKGWVMFDTRHRPKRHALVNLYNGHRKEYFNPKSGWTKEPANDFRIAIFTPGVKNTIRLAVLFDYINELECTVYFFKSFLIGGEEIWQMVGLYVDHYNMDREPGEEEVYKFYTLDDLEIIYGVSMDNLLMEYFEIFDYEDGMDINKVLRDNSPLPPLEFISSNKKSFMHMDAAAFRMMLTALEPHEYKNIEGKGKMMDAINDIIDGSEYRSNGWVLFRMMWIIYIFQGPSNRAIAKGFEALYEGQFYEILATSVRNLGVIHSEEKRIKEVFSMFPIEAKVLNALSNISHIIDLNDFSKITTMGKRFGYSARYMEILKILNLRPGIYLQSEINDMFHKFTQEPNIDTLEKYVIDRKMTL